MKKLFFIIIILVPLLVLNNCAKMGSLSGGLMDSLPPKVISSKPDNYSVNFDRNEVEITFDEFIMLNDINNELVISPPMEEKAAVKQKGKSILIELNNELRANTTYTLNFGQSIEDLHEGNPLSNYEFVFSTGTYLDSLSVYGRLLNAFDLEPPEDPVNIMLYDTLYDSAFIKEAPVYIGKSDKEGFFSINNLKADTFRLVALKDINNNYRFDLPNEQIAFLDTTLILSPEFFTRVVEDTLYADSSAIIPDTSIIDVHLDSLRLTPQDSLEILLPADTSDLKKQKTEFDKILVDLYLFTQENQNRYISNTERFSRQHMSFAFSKPVTDSFNFRSVQPPENDWYLTQISEEADSFNLWVTDTLVASIDSILLELNYTAIDSFGQFVRKTDTVAFFYRKPPAPPSRKRKNEDEKPEKPTIGLSTIKDRAMLELNEDVLFTTDYPIDVIDTSFIHLFSTPDSVEVREEFRLIRDSLNLLQAWLKKDWNSETSYHLQVFPGAFQDIYGHINDTVDISFRTRDKGFYGKLLLNVSKIDCPLIIQLMNNSDEIVSSRYMEADGRVTFDFMEPGSYHIKFIHDCNGNKKWDSGNYLKGIQPERVEFYEGNIDIRSNWDVEVSYSLKYIL